MYLKLFICRWNSRSCLEEKQYICQTKLKKVSPKGKKKLQKHYNATSINKLNEVPVPVLYELTNTIPKTAQNRLSNEVLDNEIAFAIRPQADEMQKKKKKKKKGKKKTKKEIDEAYIKSLNGTDLNLRRRRNKMKDSKIVKNIENASFENMKWKMYYEKATISPYHPRKIVEEISYS